MILQLKWNKNFKGYDPRTRTGTVSLQVMVPELKLEL